MSVGREVASTAKKNIEIIAQVEQELLRKQSHLESFSIAIASFFGSLTFIIAHVVLITVWILLNIGIIEGVRPFDPYPFAFLGLVVGLEFIFLTTFVLINQNLQMQRTERWAHLDLQLSMLTEQEVTKSMQMIASIGRQLGLKEPIEDPEFQELAKATSVAAVVKEIEKSRTEDENQGST